MMYKFDKNVFSVGCSFTEGTGVKRENNFTSELAKSLNYNTRNNAAAGHSNQYIFRKVIELLKNWQNDDILLIQWTSPLRDEIITREGHIFTSPWHEWMSLEFLYGPNPMPGLEKIGIFSKDDYDKEIVSKYGKKVMDYSYDFFYKDYQLNLSFCFQMALWGLLEKLDVKYIMFFGWEFPEIYENQKQIFNYTNDKFLKENFGSFTNTPGEEHPNTDGHKIWAEYLYKKTKEFGYA